MSKERKTRRQKERAQRRWERMRELVDFGWGTLPDAAVLEAKEWFERAQHEFERGDFAKAASACERSLALSGQAFPTLLLYGRTLMRLHRMDEAVAQLSKATEVNESNFEAQFYLAQALQATGRHQRAVRAYERVIELGAESPLREQAQSSLQDLQKRLERQAEAGGMPKEKQRQLEEFLRLAQIYRDAGFPHRVRDYLEKALELDPNNADVLVQLGEVCWQTDAKEQAEAYFARAIQQNPALSQRIEAVRQGQ